MEYVGETSDRLTEQAGEDAFLSAGDDSISRAAAAQPEGSLEIYKKSQCSSVRPGDEFCYWLCLVNRSAQTLERLLITDALSMGLEMVADSLCLDGRQVTGDITQGLVLPVLAGGDFVILSYAVRVSMHPPSASFSNTAWVSCQTANGSIQVASNTVEVALENCALKMGYYVQQDSGNCGDRINCTGYITNQGNCPLEETFLSLTPPYGAWLLPETLSFDKAVPKGSGLQQICLGSLVSGEAVRFSYQMQVTTTESCKACGLASAFGYCSGGRIARSEGFSQEFYWNSSGL